jgi:hypothetical protein
VSEFKVFAANEQQENNNQQRIEISRGRVVTRGFYLSEPPGREGKRSQSWKVD